MEFTIQQRLKVHELPFSSNDGWETLSPMLTFRYPSDEYALVRAGIAVARLEDFDRIDADGYEQQHDFRVVEITRNPAGQYTVVRTVY